MTGINYEALGYRTPLHPMPEITSKWRYDHCPLTYRKRDPQWEAMTSGGTVLDGLLRLVSGWDPGSRTFSRGPDSFISLDTYSLGIAHWWAETAPDLLEQIAWEFPELAEYAWGMYGAELDEAVIRIAPRRGKMRLSRSLHWLCAGWYEIARHPAVVSVMVEHWTEAYARPAAYAMVRHRWESNRTMACLARVANSRGAGRMRRWARDGASRFGADEEGFRSWLMDVKYEHPERLTLIDGMANFDGEFDAHLLWGDVAAPAVRTDGSVPAWVGMLERGEALTSGMCEVE